MGDHRELKVWQLSHAFAGRSDRATREFSRGHGELADQLRRAALSIPSNLAEGATRGRDGEFLRFISIAIGSAAEVDSLLAHTELTGALDPRIVRERIDELTIIRKMLFKLRAVLRRGRVSQSR